ncbi:MAG: TetR/AcrR family transcriptional regulator [Burkholderiaceae bacterium]|nr:TetR/AcrR family transcriptional regulator [Burkholderiaceae bacterium]
MATSSSSKPAPSRSYRGVSTVQRKAERRERLIQAAIQCFGRYGYHSTTLKSLCAEAGMTERYFYESFANFDEILCCAYQHAAQTIFDIVTASFAETGSDPLTRMRLGVDSYFKAIASDPARARLVLIEIEGASDNANQVYRDRLRTSADMIRNEVIGSLPGTPGNGLSMEILSTAILGAVYQLAKEWVLSNFKLPRATLVRNVEALVAGVLGQWQAPSPPLVHSTARSTRKKKGVA